MPRKAHLIKKLLIKLSGYINPVARGPCACSLDQKTSNQAKWVYTKLTQFVARGPCASQGSLDQKTSNQAKWVSVPLMKAVFLEMSDDEKQ